MLIETHTANKELVASKVVIRTRKVECIYDNPVSYCVHHSNGKSGTWISLSTHKNSSSKFYFQQNTTMEQYQKQHFVDITKHIGTLLHLRVVTREAAGLIELAAEKILHIWPSWRSCVVSIVTVLLQLSWQTIILTPTCTPLSSIE